jgi:enediyne biosynthesis thioesterase
MPRHLTTVQDTFAIKGRGTRPFTFTYGEGQEQFAVEKDGFALFDFFANCEYFEEIRAFDDLEIRMSLSFTHQNRIGLSFDYVLRRDDIEIPAARGSHEIGCMRLRGSHLIPTKIPQQLAAALSAFS